MALGAQTVVIDGQRFSVPTTAAYNPYGFAQLTQPQQISNVNFPPMLPGGAGAATGFSTVGGYGTAEQNAMTTAAANAKPWDMKLSPTVWAMLFLIGGLVGLSVIHWRKTTLGGGEANLHIGPAEGAAEVNV